jgi:hypothetical protein
MTAIGADRETFDMGRVVSQAFGAISRNSIAFFVLAFVLVGAPQSILGLLQVQANPLTADPTAASRTPGAMIAYGLIVIAIALASLVLGALLQAAVIRGVVEDLNGKRASIAELLSSGLRVSPPVIAIGLLVGLGIGLGAILLLVPGLMLASRWIVAVPARVMERPGVFAAMERSAELTKGNRWAIFGLLFAYAIVLWIISAVVLGITASLSFTAHSPTAAGMGLPYALISALVNALISTIGSAGVASIYCELRRIRDGAIPSALAAVFD